MPKQKKEPPACVRTVHRVAKVVPPKRRILDGISRSFFPGARIGVLGPDGAGRSSLLRIIAGIDREYEGGAPTRKGPRAARLPPEPPLRRFPDRIATQVLVFEGGSPAIRFAGDCRAGEAGRRRRLGAAADQPPRIGTRRPA